MGPKRERVSDFSAGKEESSMKKLAGLKPASVFEHFEAICAIPHGSGNTKAISDHCVGIARKLGLKYRQDEHNNVIIWKPGTRGYENSAPVMLQGHLDMVAVKEPSCDLDLERDGLRLTQRWDYISASDTSLGGDDGIAVAYALALLESEDITHPPLEVVLTVDEEIGMLGAAALDMSDLKSRRMLNLDSEEEGHLLVSCAGGLRANCHIPVEWEQQEGTKYTLLLMNCTGGHSGTEIHRGGANANVLMGRILNELQNRCPLSVGRVSGGEKDNAIASNAVAKFLLRGDEETLRKALHEVSEKLKEEYRVTDPELSIHCFAVPDCSASVMTQESGRRVLSALTSFPPGVQQMDRMTGTVQTSLNLGILKTEEREVTLSYSVRSSVEREKRAVADKLISMTEQLGGHVDVTGDYPGWAYREDSPLRDTMVEVYKRVYHRKPLVMGMHAGVECGLFVSRLPGLDCVSFGPDMENIHTTEERLSVKSVQRTWNYLLAVLKALR